MKNKKNKKKQQECISHNWSPLGLEIEYGYIYYECLACKEVCWDKLKFIEYKKHFE